MEHLSKEILWRQFGASIDMLKNSIEFCPENFWDTKTKFWYNAYHCLFFLDYYLTSKPEDFEPPKIFSFSEFEDRMPDRTYSKDELLFYIDYCRNKCKKLIGDLNDENSKLDWINQNNEIQYS